MLSDEEIRVLWQALSLSPVSEASNHCVHMSPQARLVLKLQLATAQRKGEVISAEYSEMDLISGWWVIPASKAKNGQAHRVPLSSLALEIIAEVKKLGSTSRFLFPSARKDAPMTATSINRAIFRSEFSGTQHFTPHDLRRTAASKMTSMGISRLVASKILNHVETGVTAVYDRHSYDSEKRQAMDVWAKRLVEIVSETEPVSNVITLQNAI